ncbi:regulator of Vps4 activity in the MVB pathway-domain-containing protein [Phellopilus nigrolimitatus]|nr:regulator of Vps4 activity in the MVB pathway-domain-containing protein [Phellopilus nigrolimitatus]
MTGIWDPARVKAQLRLTAQRLGQLQDRKDSKAHITSKDIATLLGQPNLPLARAKAYNLIKEDAVGNVLEVLEMHCGVVLEQFADLEKDELKLHLSVTEAISSIIYAAAFAESPDLNIARDMLILRVGSDFAQSALHNDDDHVSPRILRSMHWKPSASEIDDYLQKIAGTFGVDWKPQMKPNEKLTALSEMLDASDIMGTVDMQKLRSVASSGLPANPPWLRPRVWKLLLGSTPPQKVHWEIEAQKKRESYYDLIRRLLVNIPSLVPPTSPLSASDKSLLGLMESLTRVPAYLYHGLDEEVEQSANCPLHGPAPSDIKIPFAHALDARLQLVQDEKAPEGERNAPFNNTPEIRLDVGSAPSSPVQANPLAGFDISSTAQETQEPQKTLSLSTHFAPKAFRDVSAHPSHVSALLRLLYVHRSLHPVDGGAEAPHIASLLVPLYGVTQQEAEPLELAHAEADTFWLFEALLREIGELEESEGGVVWMKKFSERLAMADNELLEDLTLKGLDPALPQYSYRWLAPVLSHTLPLPAVLMAWDAIFSQPEVSRQSNPKLEHLLDICTAMLVRARARLLLLGKAGHKSPSLWDLDGSGINRQPLLAWELGEAFMEGMTFLQHYPIEEAGGVERVLQVAGDIRAQREASANKPQAESGGLGARIRDTVWRGITNQTSSADDSPDSEEEEEEEDEEETENEASYSQLQVTGNGSSSEPAGSGSGWASRFTSTLVRGITNQSAMEAPSPTPLSLVASPLPSRGPSPSASPSSSPSSSSFTSPSSAAPPLPEKDGGPSSSSYLLPPSTGSSLWGYAEKLRQSDMAAKLSKASTNISAKALDVWSTRSAPAHEVPTFEKQIEVSTANTAVGRRMVEHMKESNRHGSVPNIDRSDVYSPPPRPAFFKPPRDTRMFTPEEMASLAIPDSPESNRLALSTPASLIHSRSESLAAVLPAWTGLQPATPKPGLRPGPRPLLLSASSLVTHPTTDHISRSANSTPTPHNGQWAEVMRSKVQSSPRHRDSQYSQSSVSSPLGGSIASPSAGKGGWDSDTSSARASRLVKLNRQSVSPMAPAFRTSRMYRDTSMSSQSEFGVLSSRATSESSPRGRNEGLGFDDEPLVGRAWDRVPIPDSPSTLPSTPPPRTPVTNVSLARASIQVTIPEQQRGSVVLSESGFSGLDPVPPSKKVHRKPLSPTTQEPVGDTSDSSIPPMSPSSKAVPRVRAKRYGPHVRLTSLRIRDTVPPEDQAQTVGQGQNVPLPSPGSLAAPEVDSDSFDIATTPKATHFPSTSPTDGNGLARTSPRRRKISMENQERRRKLSGESSASRTRKISGEAKLARTRKISADRRDSVADDGDDEGYDELLSAYESEEGAEGRPRVV